MTGLLVALGAAVGAPLRFVCGHYLDGRFARGTLLVNVAGSFLLGLLSALSLGEQPMALLGLGFCGGLTTYSAFAVKTREHGWRDGGGYAVATLVLALAACAAGFALGTTQ